MGEKAFQKIKAGLEDVQKMVTAMTDEERAREIARIPNETWDTLKMHGLDKEDWDEIWADFEKRIRAHEREECAKAALETAWQPDWLMSDAEITADSIAAAIRARGGKT